MAPPPYNQDQEELVEKHIMRTLERIQETYIDLNRDPRQIVDLLLLIQPHLRALVRDLLEGDAGSEIVHDASDSIFDEADDGEIDPEDIWDKNSTECKERSQPIRI